MLRVKGWKKICHTNNEPKKAGVAMVISDKTNTKRNDTRDKERHFIMIKECIHQEDIITINLYMPNNSAAKIHEAKLAKKKGVIDKFTIIDGDFKPLLSDS